MPVITGAAAYPDDIAARLAGFDLNVLAFDAESAAEKAGNIRAANVALLGAASPIIGGTQEEWEAVIRSTVPPKFVDVNLRAFALGLEEARKN